eukprot:1438736-Prymnesium_polylepis.1
MGCGGARRSSTGGAAIGPRRGWTRSNVPRSGRACSASSIPGRERSCRRLRFASGRSAAGRRGRRKRQTLAASTRRGSRAWWASTASPRMALPE